MLWVYSFFIFEHLDRFYLLAIMSNTAVNIHIQVLLLDMFSFLLCIYLGVELLNHVVTLCLNIWKTVRLSSTVTAALTSRQQWIRARVFHSLSSTSYLPFILVGVKSYHTVVVTCLFMMTNDVEHFFACAYWLFIYLPWRNIYSDPLPIF